MCVCLCVRGSSVLVMASALAVAIFINKFFQKTQSNLKIIITSLLTPCHHFLTMPVFVTI